ncbi:MAG: hypothetical protein FJW23_05465 [Acidimicrobiia bacterium]|nr:hypothetical protein [Acidimicrobiia bacterium]
MVGEGCGRSRSRGGAGFTLVEVLIAAALTVAVLGAALGVSADVRRALSHAIDDAAVEQEARAALAWIARTVSVAGSNPYGADLTPCAADATPFEALRLDADGNGVDDDVRVQADVNPPNGMLAGRAGECDEAGEDVTIAHDAGARTLTRRDAARDAAPVALTSAIVTGLAFTGFDAAGAPTRAFREIALIRVALTTESRARHSVLGGPVRATHTMDVHLRVR